MNNMIILKAKTEFDVHVTAKVPEVGDKWEDKRNIYTITSVKRLYLYQLPLDGAEYYIVNVDVFAKDICNPDEPMTILMEYDDSFTDEELEKIRIVNEEHLVDNAWAKEGSIHEKLADMAKELEEERIKNKDFHDYKKVYEE